MKKTTIKPVSFHILLIAFFLISTLSISGCNPNLNKDDKGLSDPASPDDLLTQAVEAHFTIVLPGPVSDGESVVLEVLDEVTGLPYNSRIYQMTGENSQEFTTTVSFPAGSVVKYRYLRIGTSITPEVTRDGNEIRYRLLFVSGETTTTDILQNWQGSTSTSDTGLLSGTVVDKATQMPLADILISAAGNLTFTDANGQFNIHGLTPGIHNVVFYAMDGGYQTYQQSASIVSGSTTRANLELTAQPLVQVTFHLTAPNDALGIPVYMTGNLLQLGNTFSNLNGGMSIKPKLMPLMTLQEDGSFLLTLDLHAGTDLRYKFTLGDGFWNSERDANGGFYVRQLIVPDHAVTLDLRVASWRSPGVQPITFNINIPPENDPGDEKYIQLKSSSWTEPLPLWPLGNGNYIYILFSPLDTTIPIAYRFCRNEDCLQALDAASLISEANVQPAETAQSVQVLLSEWQNWHPITSPTEVIAADIPVKSASYQTWIELSPEMTSTWQVYAPMGISALADKGVGTIVISPEWFISSDSNTLAPLIGETPFKSTLVNLLGNIDSFKMETGLFPRIAPTNTVQTFWSSQEHSEDWWRKWFTSYRQFILNYAQIAAETQVDWFVIGGKDVMPAFPGGVFADGSASDIPDDFDDLWLKLISDIRSKYSGKLVWATNAQVSLDPLPNFLNSVDAVYITIDSPIGFSESPTLDELAYNFQAVVNSQVYDVYVSTQKPIIAGLAYPSVTNASSGCSLLDYECSNDGIFLNEEVAEISVNLEEQVLIYNATLPILANQEWINGIAIKGYDPTMIKLDGTSSIAGKPAFDVIWYWFSGLRSE